MKRQILPVAALMLLSACGGNGNQSSGNGNSNTEAAQVETIKATDLTADQVKDIYSQIPKSHKQGLELEANHPRIYSQNKARESFEDSDYSENLALLPKKDGSWLVFFTTSECWEGCSKEYHFYDYKDGKLTENTTMKLPKEPMEAYIPDKFLIYGHEDELKEFDGYYDYDMYSPDTLICNFGPNGHESEIYYAFSFKTYVWNGEGFQMIENKAPEGNNTIECINNDGVGGLRLGEPRPQNLDGFQISKIGSKWFYNRDGKKIFSIKTDNNDNMEDIEVYYPEYASNYAIGDSLKKASLEANAVTGMRDDKHVITKFNTYDNKTIEYVSSKPDGLIESIRIYLNNDLDNLIASYIYEKIVDEYSSFESEGDYQFGETDGVITETRVGANIHEEFKMVLTKQNNNHFGILYFAEENGDDFNQGIAVIANNYGIVKESDLIQKFPNIDKICEDFLVDKSSLTQPDPDYHLSDDGTVRVKLHTSIGETEYTYRLDGNQWKMED